MGAETLLIAALVGNTVLSGVSAYAQSRAAQAQANYQAQVADVNARIARQDAEAIRARGEADVADRRRRIAQASASYSADAAGRGIASSSGSVIDALGDISSEGSYDIFKIRDAAALDARNAEIRGHGYSASAGLLRGRARGFNPLLDTGTTLLSSGTRSVGVYASSKSLFS